MLAGAAWIAAGTLAAQTESVPAKLDEYLTRMIGFGFSGVALVANKSGVLLSKGYGLADRARKIPFTADTVVSIGSITKQFTAAAILKLEMQGKLRTEDPIAKFFKDVPADTKDITLHHLLTHTAGLKSDFSDTDYDPLGRDEYVQRALHSVLLSAPGKTFHYANSGYSLLAAIVEIASGQPYEQYLRKNLFEPAGMLRTGYTIPHWPDEQVAHGYQGDRDWGTILGHPWAADGPFWELRGNGAIHSTVGDMYKWHLAIESNSVLSAEARKKFETGYVAESPEGESQYAYGWSVEQTPGGRLIGHNGGNGVFAADFLRYVDAGVVVFIASNAADMPALPLSHPLGRIALGLDFVMPPKVMAMSPGQLGKYAGVYTLPSGATIHVAAGTGIDAQAGDAEGFALLNGGDAGPAGGAVGKRNEQVRAMVIAAAKGDFSSLKKAFGASAPRDIDAIESDMWRQHRDNFGEFRGVQVLGTAPDGPGLATMAQLNFERGSVYIRYMWGPGGLLRGIRMMEKPPSHHFLPESETSFVSFSLPGPEISRLRFNLDGKGAPVALLFGTTLVPKRSGL
jgi:CubicO group peptidase (beta-lactamase class C family)